MKLVPNYTYTIPETRFGSFRHLFGGYSWASGLRFLLISRVSGEKGNKRKAYTKKMPKRVSRMVNKLYLAHVAKFPTFLSMTWACYSRRHGSAAPLKRMDLPLSL